LAAAVANPMSRCDLPVPESLIRHSGCPDRELLAAIEAEDAKR